MSEGYRPKGEGSLDGIVPPPGGSTAIGPCPSGVVPGSCQCEARATAEWVARLQQEVEALRQKNEELALIAATESAGKSRVMVHVERLSKGLACRDSLAVRSVREPWYPFPFYEECKYCGQRVGSCVEWCPREKHKYPLPE